jgi:hypothetical protein
MAYYGFPLPGPFPITSHGKLRQGPKCGDKVATKAGLNWVRLARAAQARLDYTSVGGISPAGAITGSYYDADSNSYGFLAQVYLAKHRVSKLVKQEVFRLEQEKP